MSNTINKHILKLEKSIDNKLFDLLVDLEDQCSTYDYKHWKINYELRQVILRKILLDKNIHITPNKLGVYGYSHNQKIQYKEYQLTIGKSSDNRILPMYAVITYNDKALTKKFEFKGDDIKKKIQYNLVSVFKNQKKDFESIHNNAIELNNAYYRYNNIKYIYPKSNNNVNNYDHVKNFEFDIPINSHTSINNFGADDIQEQIHNNPIIKQIYNENNKNNMEIDQGNVKNDNNIKYKYNKIDDDYLFDDDDDENDDIDNIEYKNMLKQIKFYEEAMGIVSNTHKNKDKIKYLNSLKNKFIKQQDNIQSFQKYYNYAKKINENDL